MSRLEASDLFARGGDMGRRMRAHDWGATPLGPPAGWPLSLRSALSICLGSRFPIAIYWGPQLALLYNDAWSPIPGAKHPRALGQSARDVWPEIWETIGPLFEHVRTTGEATYSEDQLLSRRRHGYTEECYFNYTFSPIRGDRGEVDGIFNAVIETTFRVIAERRTRVLRDLGDQLSGARSPHDACTRAARVFAGARHDVPFSLLYLPDNEAGDLQLVAATGLETGGPLGRDYLTAGADDTWPLARVTDSGQIEASGSRSSANWSGSTAVRSRSRARLARAARFASPCRSGSTTCPPIAWSRSPPPCAMAPRRGSKRHCDGCRTAGLQCQSAKDARVSPSPTTTPTCATTCATSSSPDMTSRSPVMARWRSRRWPVRAPT